MTVDYLVVGQGIAGTLLARELQRIGASVIVIDNKRPDAPSRVAGGIINPVTGKRLVRSWMADVLVPFAKDVYEAIELELNTTVARQTVIADIFPDVEAREIFSGRVEEGERYLSLHADEDVLSGFFRFNYGAGTIEPCMIVDLQSILYGWREKLMSQDALIADTFVKEHLRIDDAGASYGNITAGKILFCDGASAASNPFFERLPWSKDKGEALIADIPGLPADKLYKQGGLTIAPWHNGLFWVGASHDWKYSDEQPSLAFKSSVQDRLNYWLRLPYTITDHLVALRPANADRRPFIGIHPTHPQVGIFNGFGGKGCSMAPYFAHHFAGHLVHGAELMPDVSIARFKRILSR